MTVDHIQRLDVLSRADTSSRGRRPLLLGTALGCSLMVVAAAGHARAQSISQNTDTDVSITQAVVNAAPFAVDVITSGGNVTIDVGQVNVTNNSTNSGYGVSAVTFAPNKLISISVDEIAATGTGRIFGVVAQASGGTNILINAGAIEAIGDGGYGIWGASEAGTVTIDAGTITTNGGVRVTSGGNRESNGVWALTDTGAVSVTADSITTTGFAANGIFVESASGDVVIDSGVVSTANTFAPGIQVEGDDITITSDSVTTTGAASPGIYVPMALGDVTITSDQIMTSGGPAVFEGETYVSTGIAVLDGENVTVTSNTVTTSGGGGFGISVEDTATATIHSGQITTSGNAAPGIVASGISGAISITSDSINTTGGAVVFEGEQIPAEGIYASGDGPITIHSGVVNTDGDFGHGIHVAGNVGAVSVTSGQLSTEGDNAQGILATTTSGNVTIVAGTTVTSGDYVGGETNPGDYFPDAITAITGSGDISITSQSASSSGLFSSSIVGVSYHGGDIFIDSVNAAGSGDSGVVIYADGSSAPGGNITIHSDSITSSGDGAGALTAYATGDVTVDSGSIVSTGGAFTNPYNDQVFNPTGLIAESSEGDVVVTSGTISTVGDRTVGILAIADAGSVSVTSQAITTQSARGVMVSATGEITVDSGSIHSAVPQGGQGAHAIMVTAGAGDVSITSDEIETAGMRSNGITVSHDDTFIGYGQRPATGGTGVLTIDSGSIITTGQEAWGIGVDHIGAIDITSDVIEATGAGIHVHGGSTIDITSGSLIADGGPGIVVYGDDGAVSVTSGDVWVSDDSDVGIAVLTDGGDITIVAGETVTNRLDVLSEVPSDGIEGLSNTGKVSVTSDAVSTKGLYSRGILASSGGAVSVDSGSVSVAGDFTYGIVAESDAAVTVASDSIVATGDGGHGMYAWSFGDDLTIVSGAIATSGALLDSNRPYAILAGAAGDLSVTSATISTVGDRGLGISVVAGGSVLVDSGSITTAGDEATGIYAKGDGTAAVTITSDAITTGGERANGITVGASTWMDYGWRAATGGTGLVTIDSGAITTTGVEGFGIAVDHQGPMSITSDSIVSNGVGGTGIYVWGSDAITIDSGDIEADAAAIVAFGAAGDIDITSDTIALGEMGDAGIYAETSTGDITIDAGTTTLTATGFPWDMYVAHAVFGWSDEGLVHIISDNASTAGTNGVAVGARGATIVIDSGVTLASGDVGRGVYARSSNGPVIIASDSATATGDGGVGIYAVGLSGLQLDSGVASSSGDRILADDQSYIWSHAIYGQVLDGSAYVTVGKTTATGAYADAVRLVAGEGGTIDLGVNGAVSSSQAFGAFLATDGQISVSVAAGASVAGAYAGISTEGDGPVGIVNRGTIRNTASSGNPDVDYAAINIAGDTPVGATVTNFGAIIAAGSGPAIWFDAGDDTVNLMTGSVITGAVWGEDGFDTVNLIGTSSARTTTQSLASSFVEFEKLNVLQGYWTATGHESEFGAVVIGANGGLEVRDFLSGGEYLSAVATPSVVNNGLLVINFSQGSEDTEGFSITGTGILRMAGAGTFNVNTNSITHTGGTIIDAGKLVLTGTLQGDLVINAGGTFQIGNGGTLGSFSGDILDNGTLIFDRSDNYEFTGGLYGSGSLVKKGNSQLYLSGEYGFTGTTTVLGGTLKLANIDESVELEVGGGELDLSDGDHEVAGLTGEGGEVNVDNGSLTVNVEGTDVFGGEITGDGDLTVSGGGTLNLTGDSTYTGTTTIEDGVLKVNGSIVSDVFIEEGGTLGGNGTVGSVDVEDGGTVGPGNSIGLLNVAGDIAFGAGSTYEVEVNAAGANDKIVATGQANLTGGTVEVLAEAGTYNRLTTYNIITAAGGVEGEFDEVTSNFAFLTPTLDYTANEVLLTLARNDIAFSTLAGGDNQAAVAEAVEAGGEGLYDAVLFQTDIGAQEAFTQLSGEAHGAANTALLAQSRYSREATLGRLRDAEGGPGVWAAAYGAHQTWDADGVSEASRNHLGGVMAGADVGMGAWRLGAAVGQERSRAKTRSLSTETQTRTTTLAGYGGFGAGALSARVGVSQAWHDIEADRDVVFPAFTDATTADFEGATTQLFGEVGYEIAVAGGRFEPFANVAMARVSIDAFTETGGASALSVGESEREAVFSSVGARYTVDAQLPFGVASPYISLAYGNTSGDLEGVSANTFGTGEAFTVTGSSLADNALLLDTGFDWHVSDNAQAGFGYQGSFGDDADEQSVRVEFSLKF